MAIGGLIVRSLGGLSGSGSSQIALMITRGLYTAVAAVGAALHYNVIANRIHRRGRR